MSLIDNLVDIVNGEKLKIDLLNININNWFEICDKLLQLKNINSDEVKYIYNYFSCILLCLIIITIIKII